MADTTQTTASRDIAPPSAEERELLRTAIDLARSQLGAIRRRRATQANLLPALLRDAGLRQAPGGGQNPRFAELTAEIARRQGGGAGPLNVVPSPTSGLPASGIPGLDDRGRDEAISGRDLLDRFGRSPDLPDTEVDFRDFFSGVGIPGIIPGLIAAIRQGATGVSPVDTAMFERVLGPAGAQRLLDLDQPFVGQHVLDENPDRFGGGGRADRVGGDGPTGLGHPGLDPRGGEGPGGGPGISSSGAAGFTGAEISGGTGRASLPGGPLADTLGFTSEPSFAGGELDLFGPVHVPPTLGGLLSDTGQVSIPGLGTMTTGLPGAIEAFTPSPIASGIRAVGEAFVGRMAELAARGRVATVDVPGYGLQQIGIGEGLIGPVYSAELGLAPARVQAAAVREARRQIESPALPTAQLSPIWSNPDAPEERERRAALDAAIERTERANREAARERDRRRRERQERDRDREPSRGEGIGDRTSSPIYSPV